MKCPYCGATETKVVDKRETENIEATRRRRECLKCEKRFTTYERIENIELLVIKKNGVREQFDRQKLLKGILRCCIKRDISQDKIEKVVDYVENELRNKETTEIKSREIGDFVMKKLRRIDQVAYIRFASVYRDFADLEEFEKELKKLLKKK
ncbi:transcriptional repressor NrdR [Candidatus Woesearchaeota archaeon]|jgi:transcriptional repressor NrdR|nr:transcriptional repressor NrdR [Candidatus Woesearchaeota archaeon]MBT7929984.1 transcriptional repressor NrdR [Candidatus Peregrinibacteria bacterium]MBT3537949.1 transcriptional repressor NrdR [Candidatus Woesearchaeota archaeon]MBT4698284.1 transcriptional repressor NrdR [Candidatus Woesearchaeota archaeon]MBT4717024.1 transcriptional repressor NrdR [Candidatus Woesearchaeota archaeon]